ncbi:NADH-dependent alcohol dehydrogenase [Enterocloster clostridioformis]|uniref:iron-containing alcohol dehydrogenase n=2 Tax=Enterocloster clostridioformis TaxID=1531 RepID=UPI00080CA08C|nr:iron-containing alcohol dehydrogenase [Enterocloster clostridioformis]ANU48382.1 NADH-dependent alcohol dehydrogenase [Lachnoclostridium sp. YL32]NDO29367.1 iron-containing alcohol dehydrogenase [Enterocloster clostridioformis]OXE68914.1 NADH-dependent alcohol dehydrogenase [Enterocloster clostridioformis]QQR02732.1 iron-containing alcohol dehydrogenase [Enterocloster clostridioformis]
MNNFIYSCPVKVYFGTDAAEKAISQELGKYGKNVMLAYGGGSVKKNGVYDAVTAMLKEAGKEIVDFPGIMPNPTYDKVQEGARLAREKKVDFILAVGGGSVIDCCKIISAQAKTEKDIWEMELGEHVFPTEFLPMGAVVTAAGTGAEMNNGAVITNIEKKIKTGVVGAFAKFAALDPAYTVSLPAKQVISGAFDTLSHCMETYFGSPRTANVSDEINEAVMRNVIRNLRLVVENLQDTDTRRELMWDSAMAENGILKLGKATDFQAHMIEHQLGAYTDCNHGCGLAVIHPALYRHIYTGAVERFAHFAVTVWGVSAEGKTREETALAGIQALADFIKEIGLPTNFAELGIKADEAMLRAVAKTSNIQAGCCRKLTAEEIFEILMECR